MHGTGTIRFTRRGLTLIELLIAMVVLLVGIYTVAAGFPRMLHAIRGEGDRTVMTRLVEQALSRMSDNQYGLPDAITGGGSLDPESFPEDLTAPHTVANALEDVVEVRGETFRVPAPPLGSSGGAYGYYVFAQGPAACADWVNGYPYVYMLVPLAERSDDPRAAGAITLASNWFHVNKQTGEIVAPQSVTTFDGAEARTWPVSNVVTDYAWTAAPTGDAEPIVRHVHGELPSDVDTSSPNLVAVVHPAHLPGGIRMVPGQTQVWARVDLQREAFGVQFPSAPGKYVLENNYGVRLGFHPADVGLTLKVDYQLRTTQSPDDTIARRVLTMIEDQPIESARTREDGSGVPFGEVRLAVKGVDSEPLFATDLAGVALATPVHVLAVDLQTGDIYADGAGLALIDSNLNPVLEDGYQNGVVAFPLQIGAVAAPYLGHVFRFIYQTLDRHTVQMQKSPRYYVDSETARSYLAGYLPVGQLEPPSLAEVDYRTYRLTHQDAPNTNTRQLAVLEFGQWLTGEAWASAESSSGETVAVSYAYVRTPTKREYVWGELHTVPVGGRMITLNRATLAGYPIEVLAVSGVSARGKGWWLNQAGRQQTLDVETVFLANPLGAVPRVQ